MYMCPYYNENYKNCNFYTGHSQEQSQRENYCLTGDRWKYCPNYTARSLEEKIQKTVRSNPEL